MNFSIFQIMLEISNLLKIYNLNCGSTEETIRNNTVRLTSKQVPCSYDRQSLSTVCNPFPSGSTYLRLLATPFFLFTFKVIKHCGPFPQDPEYTRPHTKQDWKGVPVSSFCLVLFLLSLSMVLDQTQDIQTKPHACNANILPAKSQYWS